MLLFPPGLRWQQWGGDSPFVSWAEDSALRMMPSVEPPDTQHRREPRPSTPPSSQNGLKPTWRADEIHPHRLSRGPTPSAPWHPLLPWIRLLAPLLRSEEPGLCFRGGFPRRLCCSGILGAHDSGRAPPALWPCPPPAGSAAVRCWRWGHSWGSLFSHGAPELRQALSCAPNLLGVGTGLSSLPQEQAPQASENPADTNPLLTC